MDITLSCPQDRGSWESISVVPVARQSTIDPVLLLLHLNPTPGVHEEETNESHYSCGWSRQTTVAADR